MAVWFLILACALWGLSFPVVKALQLEQAGRMGELSSWFMAAWLQFARFALAGMLLLPWAMRGKFPVRGEIKQGVMLALWGGLGMAFQAEALAHTAASTSAFLTQAYCVFLPLWVCLRDRRRPAARILAATLLVLAGGAVLSGVSFGNFALGRGEIGTLVAAGFFAFQILTLERAEYRANRSLQVTTVMSLSIALLFLPVALWLAPRPGSIFEAAGSIDSLSLVVVLAVFCTIGAFGLMNHWQPRVAATEAGLIYTSEPVFAAIYAFFLPSLLSEWSGLEYPNELITGRILLGGGLILMAIIALQWRHPPHPVSIPPMQ